jgi:hypothetical protein
MQQYFTMLPAMPGGKDLSQKLKAALVMDAGQVEARGGAALGPSYVPGLGSLRGIFRASAENPQKTAAFCSTMQRLAIPRRCGRIPINLGSFGLFVGGDRRD